jgi:hypothetical protein
VTKDAHCSPPVLARKWHGGEQRAQVGVGGPRVLHVFLVRLVVLADARRVDPYSKLTQRLHSSVSVSTRR